ncbi:MAG: DUF362 domain-containing protein [Puniceicoccaceae bacterium]
MTLLPFLAQAEEGIFWDFENEAKKAWHGVVWRTPMQDFSSSDYQAAIKTLLAEFESRTGKQLVPAEHGRVALKIYTNSGAGLHTPEEMILAVVAALMERGFKRENICLVDAEERLLREAGFLPPLSQTRSLGPYYKGIRVYGLDEGTIQSPTWFYESPLPREYTSPLGREMLRPLVEPDPVKARKSFLPSILLGQVDFWINMPVVSHHPSTGMSGALVNASLWNVTNATRFFSSPANAPVAVAEVAAIPELNAAWALNLVSLEQYQFIAGPAYNANYTSSRPEILMSVDPVILDANLVQLINRARDSRGFRRLPEVPEFVLYSMQLGLGRGIPSETRFIEVPVKAVD